MTTKKQQPELFVTCVGRQPGAIAVTLKTWAVNYDAANLQVLLLATEQTRPIAERLVAWMAAELSIADHQIITVSPSYTDSEHPAPGRALRDVLKQSDAPEHVLCYAEPGFKSMVLSMVHVLNRRKKPYTRLHSSVRRLHLFEVNGQDVQPDDDMNLRNVGIDALLKLHGIEFKTRALDEATSEMLGDAVAKIYATARRRVECRICVVPNSPVNWVVLREQRGRLYCLAQPRGWNSKKDGTMKAREVMHLRNVFLPLRVQLSAIAHTGIEQHLRNEAITCLSPSKRRAPLIRAWFEGQGRRPGRAVRPTLVPAEMPTDLGAPISETDERVLLQVLGVDPSANLISLATHAADGFDKVVFIYDPNHPQLVQRAEFVRAELKTLGYEQATFIPAGYLDALINTQAVRGLGASASKRRRIDVTPGTKAQAADFMTAINDPRCLWYMNGADGYAQSIDAKNTLTLQGPNAKSWARALSGSLNSGSGKIAPRSRFNATLFELQKIYPLTSKITFSTWLSEAIRKEQSSGGNRRLWRERSGGLKGRFAEHGKKGRVCSTHIREPGFLFEAYVGECFRRLSSDELRIGMKWSWDPITLEWQSKRGDDLSKVHRCEIDLVMRSGHRIYCVSCKSGPSGKGRDSRDIREIEAVTLNAFSRFAIPVLVRTCISKEQKDASVSASGGAILLDVRDIGSTTRLAEVLDLATRNRMPVF